MNRARAIRRGASGGVRRVVSAMKPPMQNIKSGNGTPTGGGGGMSVKQAQQFNKEQPRTTGIPFVAGAGAFTINNIKLPGDAVMLLGLIFTPSNNNADTFTVALNNNKFIDNGSILLHSSQNSQGTRKGYFEYYQPLTGTDSFSINLNTVAGMTGNLDFHYI